MINVNQVKRLCKELGYNVEEKFGDVYISTRFEKWRFCPEGSKTKLFHKGKISRGDDYHGEFTAHITAEQLVTYIKEHEIAKYSPKKTSFTVFEKKVPGRKMKLA